MSLYFIIKKRKKEKKKQTKWVKLSTNVNQPLFFTIVTSNKKLHQWIASSKSAKVINMYLIGILIRYNSYRQGKRLQSD